MTDREFSWAATSRTVTKGSSVLGAAFEITKRPGMNRVFFFCLSFAPLRRAACRFVAEFFPFTLSRIAG